MVLLSTLSMGPWGPATMQWPFWNPWGFPLGQGTISRHSYLMDSESRVPPVLCCEMPDPDSGAEPSAEPQGQVSQVSVEIE